MFSKYTLLAWAALLAMPAAASPLTLVETASLAVADQPMLAGQQAQVRAYRESAVADAQLPDPKLKLGLASRPTDSFRFTQEPMIQAMAGIEQTVPAGDKLRLKDLRGRLEGEQAAVALSARHAGGAA